MALTGPLAGVWSRPAGHPDTRVLVHASAAGPRRQAGDVISAPKGWYDAGDYNKYVVNSGISTYTLLAAWEHFPAQFASQRSNTPESGNGLPDLLNEVLWNLEWLLAMQDPDDGGVYHKLTHLSFDGTVMPHQSTAERYVVQKSTAAALNFAATMAQASRVFAAFEAQKPGLSARMLAAARLAWAWAQNHPNRIYQQPADVQTGEYGDSQLRDEFAWAAAELYISTRDDAFWTAMQAQQTPNVPPSWLDVGALAWTSLAQHRQQLTPAADQALIEQRVRGLAESLAAQWQASGYRVAMQRGDFVWGSNSVALNQGMMLIQGYRLSQQPQQLAAAQAALDYVLGRNALGLSMVTGFGARTPRHPHHRPSEADQVADPVPGFVVGGPNPGRQDVPHCPVPYPATQDAKAYLDHYCSYASNEVAINWNAPLVYLSAALQALTR
jgi:endoglucanase